MDDVISRQTAIDALGGNEPVGDPSKMDDDDVVKMWERIRIINIINKLPSAQPEQRWIPCGKCIHADGKHRWCKVLDRTINEDYFCYWAEPFRGEGEADG